MELIGITGGIGMGKSVAGEILTQWGWHVLDTDQVARDVVAPGTPGLAEVVAHFGREILDAHGALRRGELGRRVFSDPVALAQLNALLHPRISAAWHQQLTAWRAAGVANAAVTIPLLYENGYEPEFPIVVCVACSAATQRDRLRARGWETDEIERRNRAQLPVTEKMKRATRVVWTEGSKSTHAAQWRKLLSPP